MTEINLDALEVALGTDAINLAVDRFQVSDGPWETLDTILPSVRAAYDAYITQQSLPTGSDVNAERDRRVSSGSSFNVTGYPNSIRVGGDDRTQTNLLALAQAASVRMGLGDTTTITPYRDEDNIIHQLTPAQVFELWSVGAAFVSAVYQSSWTLKDDPNGIPADFADDRHWPAST